MRANRPKTDIEVLPISKIYGGVPFAPERPDPKAIQAAVQRGDAAAIMNLLMRGVPADDIRTSNGSTALTVAIADKNIPLIDELLRHGASPDGNGTVSYLSLAIRGSQDKYPDKKILSLLLQYGADPNRREPSQGTPPLLQALDQGLFESALLLLEAGADPGIGDNEGKTAFAALDGQKLFLREMLFLRMRKLGKAPPTEDVSKMTSKTFGLLLSLLDSDEDSPNPTNHNDLN